MTIGTSGGPLNRSYECCGTRVDAVSLEHAVELLSAERETGFAVHLCNAYTMSLAATDGDFAACIGRGDLNLTDGMPLVWIARRLGIPTNSRVAGRDLMASTIDRGRTIGLRHYFYGSSPQVLDRLVSSIERTWPGAQIVGAESPPFRPLTAPEEQALVERVKESRADVVWVGLGTPKQDLFVDQFRDRLPSALVAVGAAFDFHAGTLKSAPSWMHDRGLEWLYRLATEPRRLWRRYLIGNAIFVAAVVRRPPRRLHDGEAAALRGVIILAGPDGTGKTTIADALARQAKLAGVSVRRSHWRPGIVWGRHTAGAAAVDPHADPPRGPAASVSKVTLSLLDVWVAFAGPWRRARRRGLVLWERSWHDQLVDPARYRLHPRVLPLLGVAGRVVPRADAVVLTHGDVAAIHARKPELSLPEIELQSSRWTQLAPRVAMRVVPLDTVTAGPDAAAAAAVNQLRSPASAGPTTPDWSSVPLTPPRVNLVGTGGEAAQPALGIYRPMRRRARLALPLAHALHAARLGRPAAGPSPELWSVLNGLEPHAEGWAAMRSSAPGRLIVAAARDGRLDLIAKAGPSDDQGLANESSMLAELASQDTGFVVPAVRWSGTHDGWRILAFEPLTLDSGVDDESALGLAAALATMGRSGIVHGDFAPWNMMWSNGQLALIDWEQGRRTLEPLYDLAHYVIQRGALLGSDPPARAVHRLTTAGSLGTRYLTAIGLPPGDAPSLVERYVRAAPASQHPRVASYRRKVLALLP